ncbi:hypothetical protein COV05_00590 [Candidatus Uhrbacteria bacterium CG10_big_fil_rev_8_21_14_0_10_48_16]|uniref:Uncharacterized protein n=1 Tax=Candidatus Uhrbacteria bacterium CG10_big_fil_rev_8_21_14_0_10_48_16 TaxID=1975038 RepID=A0A2M8LI31_9BACT|nr:MAG: hypothetical protein COV05_00590 [Candidatus Uhrbacteria bacterium CG10_big_fil_rev_8_21_14_0_10_48_16]
MIVVLQTVPATLRAIQRALGERENVFYTSEHRQALNHVRDNEPLLDRTIVIMSNLYPNEMVEGSMIAAGIKGMRPDAWCILYTSERPFPGPSVDGVIDKMDDSVPAGCIRVLADAGIDDPERIPDLETLYTMFPWIQRPAR